MRIFDKIRAFSATLELKICMQMQRSSSENAAFVFAYKSLLPAFFNLFAEEIARQVK